MSNKEVFIKKIEELLDDCPDFFGQTEDAEKALAFFNELKNEKPKVDITENGTKILAFMQNNFEIYNNVFTSKNIGEGLGMPSRSVSGSLRKLVTDGYVEKIGKEPVSYAITGLGKNKEL